MVDSACQSSRGNAFAFSATAESDRIGRIGREPRDLRRVRERQHKLVAALVERDHTARRVGGRMADVTAQETVRLTFGASRTGIPLERVPRACRKGAVGRFRIEIALTALILVLAIISLMVGPAGLSPRAAIAGLLSGEGPAGIIVREIRLPRTLLAALIGATLGLSGAALQGLLRNPLAEPALFGAPQAAAAAAALVIAFGFAPVTSFAVPVAGILGALVSIAGTGRHRGPAREPDRHAARRACARELRRGHDCADPQSRAESVHRAGNRVLAARLAGRPIERSSDHRGAVHAGELGPARQPMRARSARSRSARMRAASLGVDVSRTRIMVVIGVALGVGAAVAVAGAVGFVGLVAPHLVRRAVGSDPARVMLPAALAGAALVLAADVAIRLGPSAVEIKLGVVTALIGVPIFLSMIFRERRLLEGAAS